MPSLIDLRRRIRSVKNTQQITKAMKVVSAAKLRRAQDRVLAARPYAQSIRRMLMNVAQAASEQHQDEGMELLAERPEKRIQLLVITADRGLAGAFNSNVIRTSHRFIQEHGDAEVQLVLIGRKGRDFFRRRHRHVTGEYSTLFQKAPRFEDALEIARKVTDRFRKAEIDSVYLVVNNFKSMMASKLVVTRVLPIELPEKQEQIDYIYEQPPGQLLEALLPRYIEAQIFRAMLESAAAEHAARMTAMEAASSNASDVIEALTLKMNRVRQASITREIIEIVSGAAALD
ncbi:MAG TPA: ATP synthase F1 subunit gamma [Bryobacteraceae bacterium]|jgi:F-type H+-transporting ATPase subunit gamma|nr:ATP synthase F1 subunit gamma [Bryobacteraceae bacterium]